MKNIDFMLEYPGWFLPIAVFMFTIYYTTILGWDGIYVILSFYKGWGTDLNVFFNNNLLQVTESPMVP